MIGIINYRMGHVRSVANAGGVPGQRQDCGSPEGGFAKRKIA